MNKPHPDSQKALWDLNCATNLNPAFGEALQLRTEISGKEQTATDNSSIRSFVRQAILDDQKRPSEPADATTQPASAPKELPKPADAAAMAKPSTQPVAAGPASRPVAADGSTALAALTDTSTPKVPVALAPTTAPSDGFREQEVVVPLPDSEEGDAAPAVPEVAGADLPKRAK